MYVLLFMGQSRPHSHTVGRESRWGIHYKARAMWEDLNLDWLAVVLLHCLLITGSLVMVICSV